MKFQNLFGKKQIIASLLVACIATMTACSDEPKQTDVTTGQASTNAQSNDKPEKVNVKTTNPEKQQDDVNIDDLDSLLMEVSTSQTDKSANSAWSNSSQYAGDDTIAKNISKGLAMGFNYQIKNSGNWTDEQIRCFGRLSNNFAVPEVQQMVTDSLTTEEFDKATEFYRSSAGKRLERWAEKHVDALSDGVTPSVNDLHLSRQEKLDFMRFMGSSADRKLNNLIKSYRMEVFLVNKTKGRLMACDML